MPFQYGAPTAGLREGRRNGDEESKIPSEILSIRPRWSRGLWQLAVPGMHQRAAAQFRVAVRQDAGLGGDRGAGGAVEARAGGEGVGRTAAAGQRGRHEAEQGGQLQQVLHRGSPFESGPEGVLRPDLQYGGSPADVKLKKAQESRGQDFGNRG